MADTPRGKTRSNWWLLGLVALVIAVAVAYISMTRRGEDVGGSLSMHESSAAPAESAMGPGAAVPEQAQDPAQR